MMSQKTQILVTEILIQQAKVEKQIEVVRQLLCEQVNFIPFSCFQKLDKYNLNAVTPQDLQEFLLNLGFPHSISETELLLNQYSILDENQMHYNDFLRATLTHDNSRLRIETSQRTPSDYLEGSKDIPYDVEYTLAKLFELEIRCQLDLEYMKGELVNQVDYSLDKIIGFLDPNGQGKITAKAFEHFIRNNNFNIYEDELDCLIRRIDYDNDGVISYSDFIKGINPFQEIIQRYSKNQQNSSQPEVEEVEIKQKSPQQNQQSDNKNPKNYNQQQNPQTEEQKLEFSARQISPVKFSPSPIKGILKNNGSNRKSVQINDTVIVNELPNRNQDNYQLENQLKYQIDRQQLEERLHQQRMEQEKQNSDLQYMQQQQQQQQKEEELEQEAEILRQQQMMQKQLELQRQYEEDEIYYRKKQEALQQSLIQEEMQSLKLKDLTKREQIEEEIRRIKSKEIILQQQLELEMARQQKEANLKNLEREREIQGELIYQQKTMERQQRLEKSVEKLHRGIQRQQLGQQLNIISQKRGSSPHQIRNSSPNQHSAKYSNKKNKLEKKLQQDSVRNDILNNSYIAYKHTNSSMKKQTPKKQFSQSHFTPNNSSYMKKSLNSSNFQNKSKIIDNQQDILNNSKYDNFKSQVRGKMAALRQSGEPKNRSNSKQSYNFSEIKQMKNSKMISSQKKKGSVQYQNSSQKNATARGAINNSISYSGNKIMQQSFQMSKNTPSKNQSASKVKIFNPTAYNNSQRKMSMERSKQSQQQQQFSTGKKIQQDLNKSQINSNIDREINIKSQQQQMQKQKNYLNSSQKKKYSLQYSPVQQAKNFGSSSKKYQSKRQRLNDELVELIQIIINFEKKIEKTKQDLALRPDFNLMDMFRYIDCQGRGLVSSLLIEDLLKELKINYNIESVFLFMRRYDLDNDGKLRFSDFAEALTPKQYEFAQILERREASYPDFDLSIQEILSVESINLFKAILKCHLECEEQMEILRKKIQLSQSIDYHEAFKQLDMNDDGYISNKEVLRFFQKNGQVITEREVDYFIDRFDRDQDKLISFGEFVEEMSPKSSIQNY